MDPRIQVAIAMALPASIDLNVSGVPYSGLLTESQFVVMQKSLPDVNRGRALARHLVEQGLLTKFQAERPARRPDAGLSSSASIRILDQAAAAAWAASSRPSIGGSESDCRLESARADCPCKPSACDGSPAKSCAVGQLIHPNIVTAYDANEEQGRRYLVLEYVDGPNLEQLVRSQGPLPWNQACDYLARRHTACNALISKGWSTATSNRRTFSCSARITPTISSKSAISAWRRQTPGVETSGDGFAGTILTREQYGHGHSGLSPPEQARNMHKLDIRSDLYSLGCTFYYLLTAQVLFPGGNSMDKLIRHGSEKPVPVTNLRPT